MGIAGGFVDYGQILKTVARRDALEEKGLVVYLFGQFNTYSEPDHDSRQHNISTVFLEQASGEAQTGSDAQKVVFFTKYTLSEPLVFDHAFILKIIIMDGIVTG
jgi:8-oxo-dGTP diphosphatase